MIEAAPELMSIEQIIAAIKLSGIFICFMIPSAVIVIVCMAVYRIRSAKKKQQQQGHNSNSKDRIDSTKNVINNQITEQAVNEALDDIPIEPENKEKFSSLTLEFTETGSVKT